MIPKIGKDYKKIIKTLEETLVQKQKEIDELKKENKILLRTAFKHKETLIEQRSDKEKQE